MASAQRSEELCAIFVHAGAGFHSPDNERIHLEACENAAKAAMAFLKNGGTAVDAVEVAIMVLEDSPITNAGYGSNLNANGLVECDATIVDHCGRCGAVGAVPNVKNPIMLARKVFDEANKPPGIQRVPPNFLVGEGAKEFAWNHGLVIVPDEVLISLASLDRWKSWIRDITKYDREQSKSDTVSPWFRRPLTPLSTRLARASLPSLQNKIEADIAATREADNEIISDRLEVGKCLDGQYPKAPCVPSDQKQHAPGETMPAESSQAAGLTSATDLYSAYPKPVDESRDIDMVTDTVGAIAIDRFGNLAAGSSSGGIGMKHQGRIGPAALIGIGTHVIPEEPTDPDGTSVAVVTSGTGEHIATTLAASTCASRVFHRQRKGDAGYLETVQEEEALRSMISKEFTGHPTVNQSAVFGAIGIMAVKKTNDGIGLYFAHNTDSFALASMSSTSTKPSCVMSRNKKLGLIAQGGSMFRRK